MLLLSPVCPNLKPAGGLPSPASGVSAPETLPAAELLTPRCVSALVPLQVGVRGCRGRGEPRAPAAPALVEAVPGVDGRNETDPVRIFC